jgi:hypothetical protein
MLFFKPKFKVVNHWVERNFEYTGNETPRQLVKLSIQKWQFIVRYLKAHRRDPLILHDGGKDTCALCKKYNRLDCTGCPVFRYTGYRYCEHTPYGLYHRWSNLESAMAELEFLKDVLKVTK